MEERDDLSGFFRDTKRLLREYADVRISLLRLQAIRSVSRVFSMLMVMLTGILMGIFILFFLGFALSAWVAGLTASPVLGHLSAALFFLILLVLGILLRRPLFQAPMARLFLAASADDEDLAASDDENPLL